MKKKKTIIQKIKNKKGTKSIDYTLTIKERKKLALIILSISLPIIIGSLIFIIN